MPFAMTSGIASKTLCLGGQAPLAPLCGGESVIPSRQHRLKPGDQDRCPYHARHLVENFLARLKPHRAIATRYDQTACNFLGAIHLAASVIWLN